MQKPLCVILMGSSSDSEHALLIADELKKFGVEFVMRVGSAHKTPTHVLNLLAEYEAMDRPKVYVTIAGRSNALSGFVDGTILSPVVACPPKSEAFGGADIFSSLRMPSGISVATICEPKNAALFVAKIFAQDNSEIQAKLKIYVTENADKIIRDDADLQK